MQESGPRVAETWVRSHPRLARLVAVAGAAAVVFAGINLFHTFGPIHLHNDGPLGSLSGAGFAFDGSTTGPWTSGYELCVQQGSDPVVIESVTPATVIDSGLRYLGAFVREIPANASSQIGGNTAGFPPAVTEALHPVAGYPVTHPCDWSGVRAAVTELDIGVGRVATTTGGGWTGFSVDYRVGATQYIVTWDTGLYACGSSAPQCTPF
jgi:hypothetical protein